MSEQSEHASILPPHMRPNDREARSKRVHDAARPVKGHTTGAEPIHREPPVYGKPGDRKR